MTPSGRLRAYRTKLHRDSRLIIPIRASKVNGCSRGNRRPQSAFNERLDWAQSVRSTSRNFRGTKHLATTAAFGQEETSRVAGGTFGTFGQAAIRGEGWGDGVYPAAGGREVESGFAVDPTETFQFVVPLLAGPL
jgi:hypothetical protein